MNVFTFNNFEEFGIFLKINLNPIRNLCSDEVKDRVNLVLNSYENSKGGCGCNSAKRKATAKALYEKSVSLIFEPTNQELISFLRNSLNNPDQVSFNTDDDKVVLLI